MSLLVPRRALALGFVLVACLFASRPTRAADGPYHYTGRVRLGVAAVSHVFDAANSRLYSSAAAFPRGVFVTNTAHPGIADRLGETPFGPIDVAPDRHELFVLSPTEHRVRVVDLVSRQIARTFDAPVGDAVFYEPTTQDLYVVGKDHRNITVISSQNGKPQGTMRLEGQPSFIQGDPVTKHVYVRLIDHKGLQVIDPIERTIIATWAVDTFRGSTMALDAQAHHLFVGFADSVLMLDTRTGQERARMKLNYPAMGLACDAASGRLMISTGPGLIVARVEDQALTEEQTVSVGIGGTYLFFDPRTGNVFAVTPDDTPLDQRDGALGSSSMLLMFERH